MARLDPQVQLGFAVDPVEALVLLFEALAQVQEARAEALVPLIVRQGWQPGRSQTRGTPAYPSLPAP